jgi:hypothetical protein
MESRERSVLRGVVVRLAHREERGRWDEVMDEHHYLGMRGLVGESLRYVAEAQGTWVALLGWSAAALKCGARDRWIGWRSPLREQRLALIANNARFLILPGYRIAHLASRVLGLNLRRLAADWRDAYAHPILVAETFVDPRYFRGTCYRAAGWIALGQTRGYRKDHGTYHAHGNPKIVMVRELERQGRQRLADVVPLQLRMPEVTTMTITDKRLDDLWLRLNGIPEHRCRRGIRHGKISILAVAICALVSNSQSIAAIAEWAGRCPQRILRRLGCRRDPRTGRLVPPSEPTIRRFLQRVDPVPIDAALRGWVDLQSEDAISVDGKEIRGASKAGGTKVRLLGAFLSTHGIMASQVSVGEKTNEIPMVSVLLDPMNIEGKVVTLDALHTQKDTATYIKEQKKADFVMTVKDNQKTLLEDIEALGLSAFPPSAPDGGEGTRPHRHS